MEATHKQTKRQQRKVVDWIKYNSDIEIYVLSFSRNIDVFGVVLANTLEKSIREM
jgi:hypothetical protein